MVIGSLARRLPNPHNLYRNTLSFSTSGAGGGRGRGGGGSPSPYFRVLGQPDPSPPPPDSGLGHGGSPPSAPVRPSFTSFGRGRAAAPPVEPESDSIPLSVAPGLGRGKPQAQAPVQDVNRHMRPQRQRFEDDNHKERDGQRAASEAPVQDANRPQRLRFADENHRERDGQKAASEGPVQDANRPQKPRFGVPVDRKQQAQPVPRPAQPSRPKMSKEDAVKNARSVLSRKKDDDEEDDVRPRGSGRRARGGGGGGGRSRDDYVNPDRKGQGKGEDADYDYDGQKEDEKHREMWTERLGGPGNYEAMRKVIDEAIPDPSQEELIEAHNINCNFEFDPEYHMEFNTNPDLDEEPPIPLRDAIEKVRPFIMAYEGIQSHEEWEECVEETMKLAPKLKELVDCYSGPDRITAKEQGEELERVAKTLPQGAAASVKRFTDRALLSLQSNPGWGFGKKTQFMDKLVREFSQPHK